MAIGVLAFVAVHTLEFHRHAVYQKAPVKQLDIAEAYLAGDGLRYLTLGILQVNHQAVQIGFLRTPQRRFLYPGSHGGKQLIPGSQFALCRAQVGHFRAVHIQQLGFYGKSGCLRAAVIHIYFHPQVRCAVIRRTITIVRKIRMHKEITHQHLWSAVHEHITENAGQTPHILALQVGAIAVAVHLGSYDVFAGLYIRRDVEYGRRATIFGESHLLPVHKEVEEGIHAVKLKEHTPSVPICGYLHLAAVGTYGIRLTLRCAIFLLRFIARRSHHARPITYKGVALVAVNRDAVPAHLPVRRHINRCPAAYICLGLIKIYRSLCR